MRYVLIPALLLVLAPWHATIPAHAGDPSEKAMSTAVNRFAVDLYRQVGGQDNLFFSPYSVSAALAMTREGARAETASQMDAVFHFDGAIAAGQKALRDALTPKQLREWTPDGNRTVPAYELTVANALWGQKGFAFLDPFVQTLDKGYGAPLQRIDFSIAGLARKTINDWVAKHTRDKIKDIVPEGMPPKDSRLALANAIYFKAQWKETFSERATKDAPWHNLDGSTSEAPLMAKRHHFGYAEDEHVQVAKLPYRGNEMSMIVVLPKAKNGLTQLQAKLTSDQLSTWIGQLKRRKLDLKLPKWKFTTSLNLNDQLIALGMPSAFDANRADFSGMTTQEPLYIGVVLHKAFIAVDEEGTEAAAATVVAMRAGSAAPRPEEPVPFVADHPFLFVIQHHRTGAILFMGRVTDPAK